MRTYKTELVQTQEPESITCDCCGKTYSFHGHDLVEAQEFHSIDFGGGFGSIFGDMNNVTADICQHCLKDRLGDVLKIKEFDWETAMSD
jgi:hypothetical protein